MNPFPKTPAGTTDGSQFQPWVAGGKNPEPRCSAVPSAGAPTGAAGAAALPIMKAQMNTAQPARNQSSLNHGLRGWARIRKGESVKSVVKSPRQSAFTLIEL